MLDQTSETEFTLTMGKQHALVVPYPVQGHVISHMELSHRLVKHGFKITFVNTEFNLKRILATLNNQQEESQINMVSIPDGLLAEEDRNDIGKLTESIISVLPREIEALLRHINDSDNEDDITCIISDMGWTLEVGEKMGIKTAAYGTMGAGLSAMISNIPKLIDTGIINPDGKRIAFEATSKNDKALKVAKWHICNSTYELEPAGFDLLPEILPIGPLLAGSGLGQTLGHFWSEDSTCLNWLNQQPARSVVYVAFGSFTIFDQVQFQELASGLELSNQPFLWVVRPDMSKGSSDAFSDGFRARVSTRGQMVGWAPQQKVLNHPSIACFLTHCGWNSTLESVSNGVPFLCWPYFADQFYNQSVICDTWKVGLALNKNENGIVSSKEIKEKVNEVIGNEDTLTMGNPHAIVVPYPVQGHVIPHMELSHQLVKCGFQITFVNTEFNHRRIAATLETDNKEGRINMVSIQDGLSADEERNDIGKLTEAVVRFLPSEVKDVIEKINGSQNDDKVTCIISDMGLVLEVGERMGIHKVALWTTGAGLVAQMLNIPNLIDTGIINTDGTLIKHEKIQLSPAMPVMNTAQLFWLCIGDSETQKIAFDAIVQNNEAIKVANWHVCNSTFELEPAAFALIPDVLPIGPLLANSGMGQSLGHFWPEDSTCLDWLNQQPDRSVVYVAFGSLTIFDQVQFQELAYGLELSKQQFLWVVRPDMTKGSSEPYPEGFKARVATQGQMVGWAPQQKVLSHPSIACFLSHCGWNSTMESAHNGVPFLCWPYFADQFQNQRQICDVWKVGLELKKNENGIIARDEIKEKVNALLGNEGIRSKISKLKETVAKSLSHGGSSANNFTKFVNGIQK
ncbi:hypothetical protein IFM89_008092 [Coptis chinensis]|uniref:UDP-glycosyltransferase n=1 Tax=Coptis chinensis TaxID=261450 RepID=A0A835IUY8_9MAGN|nr:hypothetical protein IFM89_008092 [Coptis chinensis]